MVRFSYHDETGEVEVIDDSDSHVMFKLEELFKALPNEIVDLQRIIEKIRRVRNEKISNLGNYMQMIIELTIEEAGYREKMVELANRADNGEEIPNTVIKIYENVIKACLAQKNTMNEFRHAQKFLSNEEGRLLAELAKIEALVEE